MSFLERWNEMPAEVAAEAVLACCGSKAWARGLAERRPLATLPELLAASDAAWWSLDAKAWQEAFDSHPRIGEQHAQAEATASSLEWSRGEQGLAAQCDAESKRMLALGQQAYEEQFGRIFLVCATGRSSDEILTMLERRMHNTAEAELHEAAEQQRQITHLRLQKWLVAEKSGTEIAGSV